MKTPIFGAYTVIVTPFDPQGNLDEEGLRKNLRFQILNKIEGIVILGTTGEAPTLTHDERLRITSIARDETEGKCQLMVGTGTYSTEKTIEYTIEAQNAGADSALIVTPYYNRPTQEGLYQHFASIAKAVKLPIIVYNNQSRTGQNLQTETLKRLAMIKNIVGVKEASGNLTQMMEVIEHVLSVRPDFSVMSGDDSLTLALMALGGHGIYSVLGNLMPGKMKELCSLAQAGSFVEARALHYELFALMKALFIETNPSPIKSAMNLVGLPAGPCRLPLCAMSPAHFETLKNLITHD